MEVNLLRLLQDWLDKEKFPLVSFTGITQAYLPTDTIGNVWVGDFDVGIIKTDRVGILYYTPSSAAGQYAWLMAADPDFFTHLAHSLEHASTLLKRYEDE